jgi:3-hydroxyisobutyrate dehydrogenase-like beta-hydroxyacid dehydrogenase
MGGAMAKHLLAAGFDVVGFDVAAEAMERLEQAGGKRADTPAAVSKRARVVITSLPSEAALENALTGPGGIADSGRSGVIAIETSTMPLATKEKCRGVLAGKGMTLLDCPVSGTGAQAARKDLVVFASGDPGAYEAVRHIFPGFSRLQHYLGDFGNGSKMKFLANVLVNIHNVAAAEVFALAGKAGMKLEDVYEVLKDSAGSSRMFQVRGPLMVNEDYDQPTARIEMYMKDLDIISRFAADLRCPVPLFSAATQLYFAALNQGRGPQDLAAVCAVVEAMAGVRRDRAPS